MDLPAKPSDQVTVCWVANLKPLKRPDLLLDLAGQLASRPQVRFLVIGAQQMHGPEWDALLQRLHAAANVDYLGHLAPESVNEQLAKAHLLVNTSDYEGFPNTFIQAWLRGLPVLSLNVNPDALLDDHCYGHCAAGNLQALGAALAARVGVP